MPKSWVSSAGFESDDLVLIARAADQAERYEDMSVAMKLYTESKPNSELSNELRNYLSVAYKNVVGARRGSYRTLSELRKKNSSDEMGPAAAQKKELIDKYQAEIVSELNEVCNEVLKLLDDYLIKNASTDESKVFYHKMRGDYFRYLAEVADPAEHDRVVTGSLDAYKKAMEIAQSLVATNPIKLGLALNFSVFYYEIMNSPAEAQKIAKEAFDVAVGKLDSMDEDSYKDSALIMQLLRDNLQLWTSEQPENQVDGALE